MRVYADSSFLLRLILTEPDSEGAVACYRRLGKPCLFFLPLHMLEVRNAIFQRAFHQRHSASSLERRWANRERDAALGGVLDPTDVLWTSTTAAPDPAQSGPIWAGGWPG